MAILVQARDANDDIPFILDEYVCDIYIVSYVSQGLSGMGQLWLLHTHDAKHNNSDIKTQVRDICAQDGV
jgi:hypothetical protein